MLFTQNHSKIYTRSYLLRFLQESGLALDLAVRFQINIALGDLSNIARVERFSNMVLPLLWMETVSRVPSLPRPPVHLTMVIFQRLYSLPGPLVERFQLYLNVLPLVQSVGMYFSFTVAVLFIALAFYKYAQKVRKLQRIYRTTWLDDDVEGDINRKLSAFSYVPDKRTSLSTKELEVYFSSLIRPLNQDISFQEFQDMNDNDI